MAVVSTTQDKETLSLFVPVKVSPSEKTSAVLFEPVLEYFTNNVSGSVPSVPTVFVISAVTPEVPPVKIVPVVNCANVFEELYLLILQHNNLYQ